MRAFVIAMECEAEAVKGALRPDDRLYLAGIGKVNAAAATQRAIDDGATEIVNVGLAGGFGDDLEVGDVLEVASAVEYDFDLAKLNGTRVGQLNEYDMPFLPCAASGRLPQKVLATGDRFNDSEADNLLIAEELGASLRDMEGAAVAHVCLKRGVPCRMYKCVSDVHGRGSMVGQYEVNKAIALKRLAAAMKDVL